MIGYLKDLWGEWWGSNPRPSEPQPDALPTELHSPSIDQKYKHFKVKCKYRIKNCLKRD